MHDVFRSIVISRLLYCSLTWSGFCSAADRTKLEAFLRRCRRLGYCIDDTPTVTEMFEEADYKLFSCVLANNNQVLQQYVSNRTNTQYNTRTRARNKTLISKTTQLSHKIFSLECYTEKFTNLRTCDETL